MDSCAVLASLAFTTLAANLALDDSLLAMGLVSTVLFLIAGRFAGLYRNNHIDNVDDEVSSVAITWMITVAMLAVLAFITRSSELYSRTAIIAWILLTPAMIGICRMSTRVLRRGLLRRGVGIRKVAIAGLNDLGRQIESNLQGDTGLSWQLVGYYDNHPVFPQDDIQSKQPWIGSLEQLTIDARAGKIDTVLITLPMRAEQQIRELLDQLSDSTASVYLVPDFFVFELLHSSWHSVGGLPAVSIFENPLRGIDGFGKRLVDLTLSTVGLVVISIPMLFIALAIKLTSPGPVFFRQRRYGLDGREIQVWKFRSMTTCDNGPTVVQARKNDPRITPLGAILRKTSLDELPQLFNVVEGNMSLVGPRPHATAHNEFYRGQIHGYMLRHKIKPGITGLAQVSGCRGETDTLDKMQRRIEFDHQYIRNWSIWLDLRILLRTLAVAWKQPEAY